MNVHIRLHVDSVPAPAIPWRAFLSSSPPAGVPTIGEILAEQLTSAERSEFESMFRANIESGSVLEQNVNAYVFADNPA